MFLMIGTFTFIDSNIEMFSIVFSLKKKTRIPITFSYFDEASGIRFIFLSHVFFFSHLLAVPVWSSAQMGTALQ